MNKKIRNILFALFSVFILVFIIFMVVNDGNNENVQTANNSVKKLKIMYTMTSNEYKNIKIGDKKYDTLLSENFEINLTKKGRFYVGNVDCINKITTSKILDYAFAYNNVNGIEITDAKFDENKLTVSIPEKYYNTSQENVPVNTPVQFQILSKTSDRKIRNLNVDITVNRFFNKTKNIKINGYDTETTFSIKKYKRGMSISKSDISIYLNNKSLKVEKNGFEYNNRAGTITLNISPVLIKNIYVKINKSTIFPNFLFTNVAHAVENEDLKAQYTLDASSSKGIPVGTVFTIGGIHVDYIGRGKTSLNIWKDECDAGVAKSCAKLHAYNKFSNSNNYVTMPSGGDYGYRDFIINLSKETLTTTVDKTTYTVKFDDDSYSYVVLGCVESIVGLTPAGPNDATITLKVAARTDDYIIFDVTMNKYVTSQTGQGRVKFNYPKDAEGVIKAKKIDKDEPNKKIGGITFTVYDGADCTGNVIDEGQTDPTSGLVKFQDGLTNGATYYVKEASNQIYEFTSNSDGASKECQAVVAGTRSKPAEIKFYNKRKKYALLVHKQDTEDPNTPVGGATFKVYYGQSKDDSTLYYERTGNTYTAGTQVFDTGGDGITDPAGNTVICNLPDYIKYTVKEVANSNTLYYNNDSEDLTRTHEITADQLLEYTGSCPDVSKFPKPEPVDNIKKYYCFAVKKIDAVTGVELAGALFETNLPGAIQHNTSNVLGGKTESNGFAYFFAGTNTGSVNVRETEAPEGWAAADGEVAVTPVLMPYGTNAVGVNGSTNFATNCASVTTAKGIFTTFRDYSLVLNWYKTTEDGNTPINGAQFKVKDASGNYIKVSGTVSTTDAAGTTKTCYQYSKTGNTDVLEAGNTNTNGATSNGEVCIKGLPQGTYTVEEVKPAQYHAFNNTNTINVGTSTTFAPKTSTNTFVNIPTVIEFTKKTSNDNREASDKTMITLVMPDGTTKETTFENLTTEELKQIEFNVYVLGRSNPLSFVKTAEGVYEYVDGQRVDAPQGEQVTGLHLNDERKITIYHLPWDTQYSIREKDTKVCDSSSDYNKCIGYYYPDYKNDNNTGDGHIFNITQCSNDNATSCPSGTGAKAVVELTNKPTEIMFTKKDFYYYDSSSNTGYDQSDIVDFVNDKERSDFDRITFKLKDANGKYLTLKKVGDHGSCLTEDSYSEYRYVYSDSSDADGTELHACGGHIKITNLCRGNKYVMEEVAVPEDSVYVKENTESTPTTAEFNVPCQSGDTSKGSTTNLIEDKPTRVRFEKRDAKYNYLIPDETTTFKLYRCKKGEECHPGDYNSDEEREKAGMTLMKFYDRGVIRGDEEDTEDAEGLAGVEVYRKMSDTDVEAGTKYITELHPYKGILVMRYLQGGYNYVLLETVAPKNYTLPLGRNAETTFKTVTDTVDVESVDVPNKPTSLLIKKYDNKGNLLSGAEFKIYEGKTCDPNLSAKNQPKELLKLKTIRDGIYENRETKDTDTVRTCKDREDEKCSDIDPNGDLTKLTYETSLGTWLDSWADFADESTVTKDGKKIEIQEGVALIQYLEYGHCYIIEEVKAPEGHSLPKKDEDRFTMVTIDENDAYAHSTYYKFINKPTPFQFYKYDEFNQLLDGAEFKLQKLDDNKKYHDVTVSLDDDLKNLENIDDDDSEKINKEIENLRKQAEEGVPFYKVDDKTENTTITTKNGTAVVYYLSPGQYRIIETKAAPGKELTKNPNIATFFVDESGNVYGNSIIVNKSKTERIEVKNSASAELIVNIQTGQTVIRYGLVIAIIAAIITGLMILKNKTK